LRILPTHLLLGLPVVRQQLLLLVVTEELVLLALLTSLGLGEVGVVDGLGDGNSGEVDLGRGGDNVSLTDSSERNSVEPERSADEQKSAVQLLQEDNPLAPESSSQQDQDGTGGDGSSEFSASRDLSGSLGASNILSLVIRRRKVRVSFSNGNTQYLCQCKGSTYRVVLGGLVGRDGPLLAVLGTTDRLLDGGGLLLLGGGGTGLLSCGRQVGRL